MGRDEPENLSVRTHGADAEVRVRPQVGDAALMLHADHFTDESLGRNAGRTFDDTGAHAIRYHDGTGRAKFGAMQRLIRDETRAQPAAKAQQIAQSRVFELGVTQLRVAEHQAVEPSSGDVAGDERATRAF